MSMELFLLIAPYLLSIELTIIVACLATEWVDVICDEWLRKEITEFTYAVTMTEIMSITMPIPKRINKKQKERGFA